MKGDFTRDTFHPEKHYSRVRMQQGRVQLDSDWNEQADIEAHLRETGVRDVVGPCGAPQHFGAFLVQVLDFHQKGSSKGGQLVFFSPGTMYVDGILCEVESGPVLSPQGAAGLEIRVDPAALRASRWVNGDWLGLFDEYSGPLRYGRPIQVVQITKAQDDGVIGLTSELFPTTSTPSLIRLTPFTSQPDLPGAALPDKDGTYLCYLHVWQRHITFQEDPAIRETALGGPDTATREKTVWQVEMLPVGAPGLLDELGRPFNCLSQPAAWRQLIAPSSGQLRAQAERPTGSADPCIVPEKGGFTGLENQLYRVEIHQEGTREKASFKWSRENASVVVPWLGVESPNRILVAGLGRDRVLGLNDKDWVELVDDTAELRGKPGALVQIAHAREGVLEIDPKAMSSIAWSPSLVHSKARRWESNALPLVPKAGQGDWITLEQGVQVQFTPGTYRTGDYWLIPARAFIGEFAGDVEWPLDASSSVKKPLALPPQGIEHRYCRLAVLQRTTVDGAARWQVLSDCRPLFPALTELTRIEAVCSCVGEALPGDVLSDPLTVIVLNGKEPVAQASVLFQVVDGGGSLIPMGQQALRWSSPPSEPIDFLPVLTDEFGHARCQWRLGANYSTQRVIANLDDGRPLRLGFLSGASACFTAHQSVPVLVPLCGQGQEARPGEPLPTDLAVAVRIGSLQPLANALVRFKILDYIQFDRSSFGWLEEVTSGGGEPTLPSTGGESQESPIPQASVNIPSPSPLEVRTGEDGNARARFYLGNKLPVQRVRVELVSPALLDKEGKLIDVHTCFTATLSLAREVAYDAAGCKALQQAGALDVQKAIDELCRRLPPPDPPRFFVQNVLFASGGEVLNDSLVTVDRLAGGLRIACTAPVAPESVGSAPGVPASFHVSVPPKPTCYVTLAYPWFVEEGTGTAPPVVGFQPVILQAQVSADKATIRWAPTDPTRRWLMRIFSGALRGVTAYLQVCLTLEGNFIWTPDPKSGQPKGYLAGEPLGKPGPGGRVDFVKFPAPLPDFEIPLAAQAAEASAPSAPPAKPLPESPLTPVDRQPIDPLPQPTVISGNRQLAGRFRTWFWIQAAPAPMPGTQPETPAGVSGPTLEDVQGLGPIMIDRLRQNGISQPSELVALDLQRATEILGVPEARAQRVIENARRLLET